MRKIKFFLIFGLLFFTVSPVFSSLTRMKDGVFKSAATLERIEAIIDGRETTVYLPNFIFSSPDDREKLEKNALKLLQQQDAVFHLYQKDGKFIRQFGAYFATDVFLKDEKNNYIAFMKRRGGSFKVSGKPPYEENAQVLSHTLAEKARAEQAQQREEKLFAIKNSGTIKTVYDVLPKNLLPAPVREDKEKVEAILKEVKEDPLLKEKVEIHPLRWATGRMGRMTKDGGILGCIVEGQRVDLYTIPPKNGISEKLSRQLNGQFCEFVFQLDKEGKEAKDGNRLIVRDFYFLNLKKTWEELLAEEGQEYPMFIDKPEYAVEKIPLTVALKPGVFERQRSWLLCNIKFEDQSFPQAVRLLPPDKTRPTAREIPKVINAFSGRRGEAVVAWLLLSPSGAPYSELGQFKAIKVVFAEDKKSLAEIQTEAY